MLSEPGPALGRATLFQRSGVGRKTLGRGPLPESWGQMSVWTPPSFLAAPSQVREQPRAVGMRVLTHCVILGFLICETRALTQIFAVVSNSSLWGPWCPELNWDLTPLLSLPSPETVLLPGLLLSQKSGGRKSLLLLNIHMYSTMLMPHIFPHGQSLCSTDGQSTWVILASPELARSTPVKEAC